jgi:hypothetical protein
MAATIGALELRIDLDVRRGRSKTRELPGATELTVALGARRRAHEVHVAGECDLREREDAGEPDYR